METLYDDLLNNRVDDLFPNTSQEAQRDALRQSIIDNTKLAPARGYMRIGLEYEAWMKDQLKNHIVNTNPDGTPIYSEGYQAIKAKLAESGVDLEECSIYYQLQICIYGQPPCTAKGSYFIADFAVMRRNSDGDLELYYFDTKRLETTSPTTNQSSANGADATLYIKNTSTANGDEILINGDGVEFNLDTAEEVIKVIPFQKIYSVGGGNQGVGGVGDL